MPDHDVCIPCVTHSWELLVLIVSDMELNEENMAALSGYLQQTLAQDSVTRKSAEKYLESIECNKNYALLLLLLVNNTDAPMHIRVCSAVTFKNFIKRNWRVVSANCSSGCRSTNRASLDHWFIVNAWLSKTQPIKGCARADQVCVFVAMNFEIIRLKVKETPHSCVLLMFSNCKHLIIRQLLNWGWNDQRGIQGYKTKLEFWLLFAWGKACDSIGPRGTLMRCLLLYYFIDIPWIWIGANLIESSCTSSRTRFWQKKISARSYPQRFTQESSFTEWRRFALYAIVDALSSSVKGGGHTRQSACGW